MGPTLTLAARAVPSTCVGAAAAGGGGGCLWLRHCEGPPRGGPGGRNLGGGSGGGLVLGRAGGPVHLRVCAARGGGAWVTNNIAKERDGWCARGEGSAHGCWEGGGGGEGVHGLTVLRFCPKAQSLARRLTALMGQWALGESADSSGITF